MSEQPLQDMELTEEEQAELNNEAPTNEAETNEAETNETEEVKSSPEIEIDVEDSSPVDDEYVQFKDRWAKKTPDEIIDGLWNQNKARREARKNEKSTKQDLQDVLDKIETAKKDRLEKVAEDKKNIEHNFQVDPIKATKNYQITQAEQQLTQGEYEDKRKLYAWHTQELYKRRPDFPKHAKQIVEWGLKKGYTQEELNDRYDYRDLEIMYDNYMLETGQKSEPAIVSDFDRAKTNNAPTTLSSVRGAKSGKNRSLKQRATEALEMPDEDFNDISDKELDNILRSLDQA
tara:strand:+ start:92 stop:958 length:867 start_codon:yes stop_codon:yes gene_type:complete